ncbi:NACHT domain-containing protein [Streptomyces sp. NPDC048825]|uniref:NACHT domain-containing protein n=1 Tax=Streptomyces sp. NPDC048825 TaxID=3365592 RepID=UPI0037230B1F
MSESKFSQIPKAAALGVAALVAPVAAFATGFLKDHPILSVAFLLLYEVTLFVIAFVAGALKRVRQDWEVRFSQSIDIWLQGVVSKYHRSYLRYVQAANRHLDMKGLTTRGEFAIGVESVFVNLSLNSRSPQSINTDPLQIVELETPKVSSDVWTWVKRSDADGSVLVIIGPPGSGKTTLLRHVALKLSSRRGKKGFPSRRIPVLISLRDYKERFAAADETLTVTEIMRGTPLDERFSLIEMIRESLREVQGEEPPQWVEKNLESGKFLLMLDGLDEVASGEARSEVSRWIEKQYQSFPNCSFILTSRPFGYRENPIDSATVVQVLPFTEQQVRSFIDRWYEEVCIRSYEERDSALLHAQRGARELTRRLEEAPDLLELTVNPLLLTMVANVHFYRGDLPGSRIDLYSEACEVLLGKRHQARGVALRISTSKRQSVLQALAYGMMRERVRDVTLNEAAVYIRNSLERVAPEISPSDFLQEVENSSGLVIEREAGIFSFCHLTFQEYLAAVHIKENGLIDELVSFIEDSWWRETVKLYAAQSDASPIVAYCLGRLDDLAILGLAASCVEEAREVAPDIRAAMADHLGGDVRNNAARRRAAAAAKLLGRARSFSRVSEDLYVSRTPISCLEYQLFLDSYPEVSMYHPDGWPNSLYPAGSEESPVLGTSQPAAQAFVQWLQDALFADQYWRFSLMPTGIAIDQKLARFLRLDGIGSIHCDSMDLIEMHERGERFEGVDEGVPSVPPWKVPGWAPDLDILTGFLEIDGMQARELAEGRAFVTESAGLEVGDAIKLAYLDAVRNNGKDCAHLVEVWRGISSVDIDKILRDADAATQAVFPVIYPLHDDTIASPVRDLGQICQALRHALAMSMNRQVRGNVNNHIDSSLRFYARLLSLAAAHLCRGTAAVAPDDAIGASWFKRLIGRLTGDAQVGDVVTEYRKEEMIGAAEVYELLYCSLVIHESRIRGSSSPWEGIFVFRGTDD